MGALPAQGFFARLALILCAQHSGPTFAVRDERAVPVPARQRPFISREKEVLVTWKPTQKKNMS